MSYLSDEQMLLLEQLTYLQETDIPQRCGANVPLEDSSNVGKTLGEIFEHYDLDRLQGGSQVKGYTTNDEWSRIIEAIRSDPQLANLELTGERMRASNSETIALVYVPRQDPNGGPLPEEALPVVTFKGTAGEKEWVDNIQGADVSDTAAQREALEFIEQLPYEHLVVTGHSKGANKACYVALLSDKVEQAVTFDGQGFSRQFLEKYYAEIALNSHKLTCYALSSDFVHELLFQIPGADYLYVKGYGVSDLASNHVLAKFLSVGDNGEMSFNMTEGEDEAIAKLRELVNYLIITAEKNGDLDTISLFLEDAVRAIFSDENDVDFGTWLLESLVDPQNTDKISCLLAYLLRYMDDYDVSKEELLGLLKQLGLFDDDDKCETILNIIFYLKEQITDGNSDPLLKIVGTGAAMIMGIPADLLNGVMDIWDRTEATYLTLPPYDRNDPIFFPTVAGIRIFDFSQEHLNGVHDGIDGIELAAFQDPSSWRFYAGEEWYGPLLVDKVCTFAENYYAGLSAVNRSAKPLIDTVFENACAVDLRYAESIQYVNEAFRSLAGSFRDLAQGRAPYLDVFGTHTGAGDGSDTLGNEQIGLETAGAQGWLVDGAVIGNAGTFNVGAVSMGWSGGLLGYGTEFSVESKWKPDEGEASLEAKFEGDVALAEGSLSYRYGALSSELSGKVLTAGVSGTLSASLFKNGRLSPGITLKGEASAFVLQGEASRTLGTEDTNIHAKAEGDLLTASANAQVGIGEVTITNEDGSTTTGYGAQASVGAEAYVAKGKVSGGFTIFGIEFNASVEGKAGGAGVTAGAGVTTEGVSGKLGAGLGLGAGIEFSIDWSGFKWPKFELPRLW